MIVRGGMRLALLAVALGLPMALAAAKLTTSLLYGVKPSDVATFTLVPLLLMRSLYSHAGYRRGELPASIQWWP
jgi:hypothetical protein